MITLQQNASHGQEPQLNLPTGPTHLLRGRTRTDADKAWHSQQVKVGEMEIENVHYRDVFRQMVFHGSCNPGRLCFAAHATIADAKKISTKTVQHAARYLEGSGLIRRISEGKGRTTGTYQILGRTESPPSVDSESTLHGLKVHQIEEGIEEGIEKNKEKALSVDDTAQTIDPIKSKAASLSLVPSPSKSEEKRAPVREPDHRHPKQVALYCKLRRRLGLEVNRSMETAFDGIPHSEKKHVIDDLVARESEEAHQGKITPAPIKKPQSTGTLTLAEVGAAGEALRRATCQHEPSDDLPVACRLCGGYIGGAG